MSGGDEYSGHSHAPKDFGRAFLIGVLLNTAFVVTEAVFGLTTGSLALVADAGHNLSDVLGLLLAWWATALSKRPPTPSRTYGLKSSSILAALGNAVLLLIAIGAIAWEAIGRFNVPQAVPGSTIVWVAAMGIAINTATALLFVSGTKSDINIKGAFLHMAADAAVSAGVVVAGLIIMRTGLAWIDPVVSLAIVAVVALGTWGLFRDSLNLALQAAPSGTDVEGIKSYLGALPGVSEVHDLHVWAMSTTETALTAHLVMPRSTHDDAFLQRVAAELHDRFSIEHSTIQIERGNMDCRQAPDEVV